MQGALLHATALPVLHFAKEHEILLAMAELKRGQDEISRQNLVYVIQACSKRLGRSRGGQNYLAAILGTTPQYLSSVAKGYEDRNVGRDLKAKIELKFDLPQDWMDDAHDASIVEWLSARVPSHPRLRSKDSPRPSPPGYVRQLESTLDEALKRISALESALGSKSNTRK